MFKKLIVVLMLTACAQSAQAMQWLFGKTAGALVTSALVYGVFDCLRSRWQGTKTLKTKQELEKPTRHRQDAIDSFNSHEDLHQKTYEDIQKLHTVREKLAWWQIFKRRELTQRINALEESAESIRSIANDEFMS